MRSVAQSLLNRGVDGKYRVYICETQQVATFMLYSPSSKAIRGYQQYRPFTLEKRNNDPKNSRYFTYQPRVMQHGDPCVFGLEYCNDLHDDAKQEVVRLMGSETLQGILEA